ncbi:ATP-dependent DNA DEAD/DEAH box helicase [Novymonas esmeraldas]|uniref:DNA 3'-5' helicase n=1 Tax=Novymonas esmeraldas TaxID=1808958 RepID=A0AAW0F2B3_9TRYP
MASSAAACLGSLQRFLPHRSLTTVQEAVVPALFTNDLNCLVAAPTGSGKTVLLEVAMLRLFSDVLAPADSGTGGGAAVVTPRRRRKAVYICPIKALANEKYEHWRLQFPTLTVVMETGDQQQRHRDTPHAGHAGEAADPSGSGALDGMASVSQADILVTTPERWDSITRRWKEKDVMAIVSSVGLLLLDEVHTVQEERGAAMEAIVSRVKIIQAASTSSCGAAADPQRNQPTPAAPPRIVAISGTLPNCSDLAEWLRVPSHMTFTFSAADRPVPLTIRVVGYAHDSPNPFAFHRFLCFKLFALIQQHSLGKPTLVFCASRKETTSSALHLVDDIRAAAARQGQTAQLQPSAAVQQLAQQAGDRQLCACLLVGVGFHHAAMTKDDRQLVERMFREQYIAVVCATTTLALGVNLPAHLVVVKGTSFFGNGRCQDMPISEVLQMCGRAGRPGFDTHGMALVLTMQRSVRLYETLASGAVTLTCVESHLHRHMIEHVNAEVGLRTIHSFAAAMEWVKTTLFWIRLRKCPRHYGLEFTTAAEEQAFDAEGFVEALMERVLRVLIDEGCVRLLHADATMGCGAGDVTDASAVFEATRLGRAMSRMYILFDTVCTLNARVRERGVAQHVDAAPANDAGDASDAALHPTRSQPRAADTHAVDSAPPKPPPPPPPSPPFTLCDVLQLLCHCQELVEVRLRQGDRGPLNELNKSVKYPLQSGRRGGREVREDWQKAYVLIQAHIGVLPLTEVALRNELLRLWAVVPRVSRFVEEYAWVATQSYSLARHANVLARCIERRVWPDGLVLRQLTHVSDSVAKALLRSGCDSFAALVAVGARQLEVLCGRLPPFGTQVLEDVGRLPRVSLELRCTTGSTSTRSGSAGRRGWRAAAGEVRLSRRPWAETAAGEVNPTAVTTTTDSRRLLLLVGMSGEDCVLLKRYVPLAALDAAPVSFTFSFTWPPPPARTNSGSRVEAHRARVVAQCMVLPLVGLDAVATMEEEKEGEQEEEEEGDAVQPPPDEIGVAALQHPTRRHRRADDATPSITPAEAARCAEVAADARAAFDGLLGDLTYIADSDAASPRGAATPQPPPRKRVRADAAAEKDSGGVGVDGTAAATSEARVPASAPRTPPAVVHGDEGVDLRTHEAVVVEAAVRSSASSSRSETEAAVAVAAPPAGRRGAAAAGCGAVATTPVRLQRCSSPAVHPPPSSSAHPGTPQALTRRDDDDAAAFMAHPSPPPWSATASMHGRWGEAPAAVVGQSPHIFSPGSVRHMPGRWSCTTTPLPPPSTPPPTAHLHPPYGSAVYVGSNDWERSIAHHHPHGGPAPAVLYYPAHGYGAAPGSPLAFAAGHAGWWRPPQPCESRWMGAHPFHVYQPPHLGPSYGSPAPMHHASGGPHSGRAASVSPVASYAARSAPPPASAHAWSWHPSALPHPPPPPPPRSYRDAGPHGMSWHSPPECTPVALSMPPHGVPVCRAPSVHFAGVMSGEYVSAAPSQTAAHPAVAPVEHVSFSPSNGDAGSRHASHVRRSALIAQSWWQ